jgi:hypothetical protein
MAWSKVMNQDQGDVLEAYQVRLFSRTRNPVTQKFHSHGNFFPLRTTCLSFENHPILLLQQKRTKVEMHAILCWRGLAVRQNLVEIMLTPTVANERIRVIHPSIGPSAGFCVAATESTRPRRIARKENRALDVEDNGCLAGLNRMLCKFLCCQGGPTVRVSGR